MNDEAEKDLEQVLRDTSWSAIIVPLVLAILTGIGMLIAVVMLTTGQQV